jgi:hypothetical protein
MFCQICCNPKVNTYDVCSKCQWQNENTLENLKGNLITVGFRLSEQEKNYWSYANRSSPKDWIKIETCSEDLDKLLNLMSGNF